MTRDQRLYRADLDRHLYTLRGGAVVNGWNLRPALPLVVAFAVAFAACGDDSTGPAPLRNDPGTGTQTMLVTADIEAKDVPGGFVTDFEVQLRDEAQNPISGATVTVRNDRLGTVTLLEADAGSGDYEARRNTFASGDYRLDVVRDADEVRGVVIGGMAAHAITAPEPNDTVAAGQPLTITWTRPSEAAGADVESREFSAEDLPDSGEYTLPGASLEPREDERIRVWRYNQVAIAGGLSGSRLELEVRNTVEPVVVR